MAFTFKSTMVTMRRRLTWPTVGTRPRACSCPILRVGPVQRRLGARRAVRSAAQHRHSPPAAVGAAPGTEAPRVQSARHASQYAAIEPPLAAATPSGIPAMPGVPAYREPEAPLPSDQAAAMPADSGPPAQRRRRARKRSPTATPDAGAGDPMWLPRRRPMQPLRPIRSPAASARHGAAVECGRTGGRQFRRHGRDRARTGSKAGQLGSALRQLSGWYDDPRLSPVEKTAAQPIARPGGRHGGLFDATSARGSL